MLWIFILMTLKSSTPSSYCPYSPHCLHGQNFSLYLLTTLWNVRSVPLKPRWWSMDGVFIQKSFYFHLIINEEIMLVVRKTFTPSSHYCHCVSAVSIWIHPFSTFSLTHSIDFQKWGPMLMLSCWEPTDIQSFIILLLEHKRVIIIIIIFIYCNWVVILHVNKTWNWLLLNLSREGYMRSM